jgi:hypothetical protein
MTSTSDITIAAIQHHQKVAIRTPFDIFANKVAKEIENVIPKGDSRKRNSYNVMRRRIFTVIVMTKYNKKTLKEIALCVAKNYDVVILHHATVLHHKKEHNRAMSEPKGNREYVFYFNKTLNYLLSNFVITNRIYDKLTQNG